MHTKYIAFTFTMYDRNGHHNAYQLCEKVQGTNQWQETEEGMVIIIKNSIKEMDSRVGDLKISVRLFFCKGIVIIIKNSIQEMVSRVCDF